MKVKYRITGEEKDWPEETSKQLVAMGIADIVVDEPKLEPAPAKRAKR